MPLVFCSSILVLSGSFNALSQSQSAWELGTVKESTKAAAKQVVSKQKPESTKAKVDASEPISSNVIADESIALEPVSSEANAPERVAAESEAPDAAESAPAEAQVSQTLASEPIAAESPIRAKPQIDLSPELRESLERQFQVIREIEEEEDAFSENLGESYLAYGKLLAQAGRLDEASEMYAKALHLAKINNGVYAIEQRPVLRAVFEMHAVTQDVDKMEASLRQVVWLEKKHPKIRDAYSYDMVVRLGNLYIDQYLRDPRITELTLERLNDAIFYLKYAVNRYGDSPLSERVMPYGELALLYLYKTQIINELGRPIYDQQRFRSYTDLDKAPTVHSRRSFLGRAVKYLNDYGRKAETEGELEHQVRAARDLGDLYLLFNRGAEAARYYNQAWLLAAELDDDHELVKSFEQPEKIPNFNYAGDRLSAADDRPIAEVPLTMNIDRYGRVEKVLTKAGEGPFPKLITRAKRASRKMVFRPAVENGQLVATNDFSHEVKVALRNGETLASVQGAN